MCITRSNGTCINAVPPSTTISSSTCPNPLFETVLVGDCRDSSWYCERHCPDMAADAVLNLLDSIRSVKPVLSKTDRNAFVWHISVFFITMGMYRIPRANCDKKLVVAAAVSVRTASAFAASASTTIPVPQTCCFALAALLMIPLTREVSILIEAMIPFFASQMRL